MRARWPIRRSLDLFRGNGRCGPELHPVRPSHFALQFVINGGFSLGMAATPVITPAPRTTLGFVIVDSRPVLGRWHAAPSGRYLFFLACWLWTPAENVLMFIPKTPAVPLRRSRGAVLNRSAGFSVPSIPKRRIHLEAQTGWFRKQFRSHGVPTIAQIRGILHPRRTAGSASSRDCASKTAFVTGQFGLRRTDGRHGHPKPGSSST